MPSMQPSFHSRPVQAIRPDAHAAGTVDGAVDLRGQKWVRVIFNIGDITTGGTVTCSVRESDNSDGSSSAAITGASLTALTPAGDRVIRYVDLLCAPRKRYLVPRIVVATQPADASCTVELSGHQEEPDDSSDSADATILS